MGGLGVRAREGDDQPDVVRLVVPVLCGLVLVSALVVDPAVWWAGLSLTVAALALMFWSWYDVPPEVVAPVVLVSTVASQSTGALEVGLFMLSILGLALTGWGESRWTTWVLVGLTVTAPMLGWWLLQRAEFVPWIWTIGVAFPAAMGWAVHRQEVLVRELTAARHELAEQAVREERRRVARDVHDLVGHGLAAAMVQVTSARHVLFRDPEAADEALATAERVGRASMRELRATLSVLRDGDEGGQESASPPGADDISRLVEDARSAGLDVTLLTEGDTARVDPVVGVTLYRIAQEALTNATRHAPKAETTVRIHVDDAVAVLEVASLGQPAAEPDQRQPRYGILGMRERAEVVGGTLLAGPVESGWLVRCEVPL
ncbi:sensor histidine kinase [Nocardioides speluncae]|uniref:sensor histidine kinase n=1 Tax=Nocardioides speluncae TaxID=2670337 RepID=UPI0012B165F5|nr:histidine kinase [Nocardioides speluncae]